MNSDSAPPVEQSSGCPHFKRIMDSADGRELIPAIVEKGNPEDLVRFFTARANWCGGYPLIHDRYTYDAFEDLLPELSSDQCLALVPTAVTITENVSDEDFHTALMLLADLLPDDAIRPRPEGFSDSLLKFRARAIRLSHMSNLSCTWNTLATKQRCYKSSDDPLATYTAAQLYL